MRTGISLPLITACLVALAACGGANRTEQTFSVDKAPSARAGDLQVQVLRFKQRDGYLIANLRLANLGTDAITLKNPGATMMGFSASAEGRTAAADQPGRSSWSPWTGTVVREGRNQELIELPAGQATEVELRWSWRPPLPRHDYAWTITVGQAFKGAARLPDLRLAHP